MKKYFVCSDVHSFFTEFQEALTKNGFEIENPDHIIVICGDLFDRGKETLQLYSFVRSLPDDRFIYIRGNHEDLLAECYEQLVSTQVVSSHHISNGTLGTILDFCSLDRRFEKNIAYNPYHPMRGDVMDKMHEILDYINHKCVNYVEIGDFICVHGWIPCGEIYFDPNSALYRMSYMADWRNASPGDWYSARWTNGMEAWHQGVREPEKTIICGHFHCSYGWSWLRQERQEFPNKSKKGWEKSFEPFIDGGICAIDACTAYSGIVNVVVLEVEDEENVNC